MQAVVKTGGKQYRVGVGSKLKVEKLDLAVGEQLNLEEVLLVNDDGKITVGAPFIKGAQVKTTVLAQGRADKVMIFKMRRRKHYRKTQGHRQSYTQIQVDAISL